MEPIGTPTESGQPDLPAEPIPEPATGSVAPAKSTNPKMQIDTPLAAGSPPSPEPPGGMHIQTISFQTGDLIRLPATAGD